MYRKIIFATDLSPMSDQVLSSLGVLRAVGTREVVLTYALGIRYLDDMRYEIIRRVEPHLERQRAAIEKLGFAISIRAPRGLATEEIVRVAAEQQASLIVVGSHGHTLAHDVRVGSTPLELFQHSLLPVLVMRVKVEGSRGNPQYGVVSGDLTGHVLYATDLSGNAEIAFEHVMRFAAGGDKRITLLQVQEKVRIRGHLESRLEEFNRIDQKRLDRRKETLGQLGAAKIETLIVYGHATEEIIKAARNEFSLVILRSQGRGFFKEVFLGCSSHNVVRHATTPVLVVPTPR